MTDKEFLEWCADRFVHQYHESPNMDYVLKLRELAGKVESPNGWTYRIFKRGQFHYMAVTTPERATIEFSVYSKNASDFTTLGAQVLEMLDKMPALFNVRAIGVVPEVEITQPKVER